MRSLDSLEERFYLGLFALGDQFNASIRQVLHKPTDLVAAGDFPRTVPEPDALNAARIMDLRAFDHDRYRASLAPKHYPVKKGSAANGQFIGQQLAGLGVVLQVPNPAFP